MLLHDSIFCRLEDRASDVAVECTEDGGSFSYGQLCDRARVYGARFTALGLSCGDRVGLIVRKSPDAIAAFLGASLVGVVYVPLDTQASPSYWISVLEELDIRVVFSDVAGVHETLRDFTVCELGLSEAGGAGDPPFDPSLSRRLNEEHGFLRNDCDGDAFVLATSGSTGRPKGVLLSHANALAFTSWACDEVGLSRDDKLLSVAPFHFDLSVFDIYGGLSRGARIVLAPSLATMFPGQLIAAVEEHKITVLYTVPTVLRMLVEADAFRDGVGASLRTIIYAGEPFPAPSLRKLMQMLPHVQFFNFFGPTETNVCLAHRFLEIPDDSQEIPIGRPASGAKIKLVDPGGRAVSEGDIGELVVEGPSVMKGYVRAEGFERADRQFATGDFAQIGSDGNYYFRGRRDQQVKVRGSRIELGSVERALMRGDGVAEAVALVVERDLVGFVAGEGALDRKDLRKACARVLPPGSVPHKIVALAHLPRLSNGKLDLSALKVLAAS